MAASPARQTSGVELGGADGGGENGAGTAEVVAPTGAKPWLKKRRPVAAAISTAVDGEGDGESAFAAAKPWKVSAAALGSLPVSAAGESSVVDKGAADKGPRDLEKEEGDEGGVMELEACLQGRDWKKRLAVFEVIFFLFHFCCFEIVRRSEVCSL